MPVMDTHKTGILVYQTWKLRLGVILALLIVLVGGWQLYALGHANANADLVTLKSQRDHLRVQLEQLDERNQELERRMATLERAQQVDAQAYAALREERTSLESQILSLQEELNFYRGIMAPGEVEEGLHVRDFSVEPGQEARQVRVRFVLVQIRKIDRVARGKLFLQLAGRQDGKPRTLDLKALTLADQDSILYRFRYFQHIDDEWVLPEGFVPERMIVKAVSASQREGTLEWTLDWPTADQDAEEEVTDVGTQAK